MMNVVFSLIGTRGALFISKILTLMVVSRHISPSEFSIFVFFNFCFLVASSFYVGMLRYLIIIRRVECFDSLFYLCAKVLFCANVLILIISYYILPAGISFSSVWVYILMAALASFLYFPLIYYEALAELRGEFYVINKSSLFSSIFFETGLVLVLISIFGGVLSIVIGKFFYILFYTFLLKKYLGFDNFVKISLRLFFEKSRKQACYFISSWHFILVDSLNVFSSNIDNIIVGNILGSHSMGIYTRAYNVLKLPVDLIGVGINRIVYASKSSDDFLLSSRIMILSLIFFTPISIVISRFSDFFVAIILGKDWLDSASVIALGSWGIGLRFANKVLETLVRKKKNKKELILIQVLYFLSIVFFVGFGSYLYLLDGAIIGFISAVAFQAIFYAYILKKRFVSLNILLNIAVSFSGIFFIISNE